MNTFRKSVQLLFTTVWLLIVWGLRLTLVLCVGTICTYATILLGTIVFFPQVIVDKATGLEMEGGDDPISVLALLGITLIWAGLFDKFLGLAYVTEPPRKVIINTLQSLRTP